MFNDPLWKKSTPSARKIAAECDYDFHKMSERAKDFMKRFEGQFKIATKRNSTNPTSVNDLQGKVNSPMDAITKRKTLAERLKAGLPEGIAYARGKMDLADGATARAPAEFKSRAGFQTCQVMQVKNRRDIE